MVAPQQATAVPTMRLTNGSETHTIVLSDGSPADQSPIPGIVVFHDSLGDWSINVTTGIVLNEGRPYMDLNSINISNISSGTTPLSIYFSQTGFTTDNGYWEAAIGGTTRSSLQYSTYLGTSNTLFDTSTPLTNSGLLGPGAFANMFTSDTILTSPYLLTQYVEIAYNAGTGGTSFNAELRSVPEPSALLLMGLGFLGLALWQRREAHS